MRKRIVALLLVLVCLLGSTTVGANAELKLDLKTKRRPILNLKINKQPTDTLDFWKNKDDEYYSTRYKTSGNNMLIKVRFANSSDDTTIDAIDLAIYCTNAYDEYIYPDDEYSGYIRYFTTDTKIKPGRNTYTGYLRMDGCKQAKEYHIAIVRFHTTDGDTVNMGDSTQTDPLDQYRGITWDLR